MNIRGGFFSTATHSQMLPRSQRLTVSKFAVAFNEGRVVRHPLLQLRVHRRRDGNTTTRAAFVVARKLGTAVLRNRVRRRLRERYRLSATRYDARGQGNLAGCDLIFFANPATLEATTAQLDEAVAQLLQRASHQVRGHPGKRGRGSETAAGSRQYSSEESTVAAVSKPTTDTALSGAVRSSLMLIRFYQRYISPLTPPSCRFEPTCSRYTYQAIERFGFWSGLWRGFCRICKCQPFHPGGYDPLPESQPESAHPAPARPEPIRKIKNDICTQ